MKTFENYAEACVRYADDVICGSTPANKSIKDSCSRFKRDLISSNLDSFRYRFDAAAGGRACKFIELLYHTKGKWFSKRERATLQPFQIFIVMNIFGWLKKGAETRRFREADLFIPRKNGKSFLSHGIALYIFVTSVDAPEVYCLANSKKQADEVWIPCKRQCEINDHLRKHYGITVHAQKLTIQKTGGKLESLIGKPSDGPSPSVVVLDEFHQQDSMHGYDWAVTGMGAREEPLLLVITTAGDDISSPCYERQKYAEAIADGVMSNEQLFVMVWTADSGDAWNDMETVKKTNPNLGVSIFEDGVISELNDAMQSPSKQSGFKTKRLNMWVQSKSPLFDMEKYTNNAPARKSLEELVGRPCLVGIDLASKIDLAAMIALFPPIYSGEAFYVHCFTYLPEDLVLDGASANSATYRSWADQGYLTLTPGGTIDFRHIKNDLLEIKKEFTLLEVGYDPAQATQFSLEMTAEGVSMIELSQSISTFSEPMKECERLIAAGGLAHGGNPILAWCMSNVVTSRNYKDEIYPRKNSVASKIDLAVALFLAINRATSQDVAALIERNEQLYSDRGMLYL